jgi:hypothetical protein
MDNPAAHSAILEMLDSQPDHELRAMIERAKSLLAARASDRRKQALAQIHQLAREHGLNVAVKQPGRKRGRPRNSGSRDADR